MRTSFRFGLLFLISLVAFAGLAGLVMILAPAAAASAGPAPAAPEVVTAHEVLVPGLASPRDLIFYDGALYAALAGSGGPDTGLCVPSPEGGTACLGETGKVIRVDFDASMKNVISVTDVVTGLPSIAAPGAPITANADAIGAQGIAFDESGNMYLSMGLGGSAISRTQIFSGTSGELLGHLVEAGPGGVTPLVDISAYEDANNPAGGPIDSNPWYMVYDGGHFYLTDAGGNDLLDIVTDTKTISTVAVFPVTMTTFITQMIPMEAVPTGVDIGPNGNFFVGQLTGFPFPPGGANVFEVDAGGTISTAYSGFTNITDIAFDEEGNLYVLEMATNGLLAGPPIGAVVRIAPDGTRTVLADDLLAPTGMTVGPDGALYISNFGVSSAIGQIVRVETEFDLLLPIIKRAP